MSPAEPGRGRVGAPLVRLVPGDLDYPTAAVGMALAATAEDSLGGAVAVATQAGVPALADRATDAFGSAFATTSLVGGLAMLTVAVVVHLVAPKALDITVQEH